jgi:hypothetical protein
MGWVKDWQTFPRRVRLLLLPRSRKLTDALNFIGEHPEALETVVRNLIIENRPELAGCSICAMGMNYRLACWEVHVEHPSFTEVPMGCEVKCEPLIPEGSDLKARTV